jgi:hypothetical protein
MRNPFTRTTIAVGMTCAAALAAGGAATAGAATKTPLKRPSVSITAAGTVSSKTAFKAAIGGVVMFGKTHLGGRTVVLEARRTGATRWTSINHRASAARTGVVEFLVTQSGHSEQYRLVEVAGGGYSSAASMTVTVRRV